jgi:ATP-dependent DNA helicase DinG
VATPEELIAIGMKAFDAVLARVPGFRIRAGQRDMALEVARAFATADLGESSDTPQRALSVVQAGTGVGKSAAYIIVGAAIAKARKTRLLVSTSTVSLQDQLMSKDLPMLAAAMPEPFTFALAKGRGRYVCRQKLLRRASIDTTTQDVLDLEDEPSTPVDTAKAPDARVRFYRKLVDALGNGWEGDRDSLADAPAPEVWTAVAADRHSCTARACPHYSTCSYYEARKRLAGVDLIVANHNLVLASVGAHTLPDLESCLVVFDEGHHLPAKAVEQFAATIDLTRLKWLDKAAPAFMSIAAEIEEPLQAPIERMARELKATLADIGHLIWDNFSSGMQGKDGIRRLHAGEIEAVLAEPLRFAAAHAGGLESIARVLHDSLRERMKDEPARNARWSALYSVLGGLAHRISNAKRTTEMLLETGEEARTTAKWCSAETSSGNVALHLHACPILPGDLLAYNLWHKVRAAVVTSATMTSCGGFEFFLQESGLASDPAVTTTVVQSPFDYAKQGTIIVRKTEAQPRSLGAYNAEVAGMLADEVANLRTGALALFTSRRHLELAYDAIPEHLRDRVLVQGSAPRAYLLATHRQRVAEGMPSIILGLQSFGEGMDLPGSLCDELFIAKLPFESPASPVGEARSEYVQATGGNPFDDLVVPATGVRMLQWTGRGIRTETDKTRITCFDRRLTETAFGRRILSGLPPYPVRVEPRMEPRQVDPAFI